MPVGRNDPLVIDGYDDHISDFQSLLATKDQATKDAFNNTVISPCENAEKAAAGTFCEVVIIGHSDRNDDPTLTPDQKRADELQVSGVNRAGDALFFVFQQVSDLLSSVGVAPPPDKDSTKNFLLTGIPAGAANMINPTPTTEDDRKKNRRVEFRVTTFAPP